MTAPFVPLFSDDALRDKLTSASGARVFKQASSAPDFVPMTVEANSSPAPVSVAAHECKAAVELGQGALPSVTVERDGDRVKHIRIQCTCGGVIELECAY